MTSKLALGLIAFCILPTAVAAAALWPRTSDSGEPAVTISGSEGAVAADRTSALEGSRKETPGSGPGAVEPGGGEPALDAPGSIGAGAVPGNGPYAVRAAAPPYAISPKLKHPPAAGLLFDVDSGEVLWARRPADERPIASLTKMMTALLIAERHGTHERVGVGPKPPGVEGSRIGVLRTGRSVPLGGLFLGLLLVSGNDAAVALAEHDAGTVAGFVRRMNRRGAELGLECTRFGGPAGLQDTGNGSCAYDLAALARASLANRWIASVTRRRSAQVPFPVKGGRLSLSNNHYFAQRGIAGLPKARVTGLKTGFTNGAGRCYVTTARHRGRHLGVVLLDSPDPIRQVPALLRAGFAARR